MNRLLYIFCVLCIFSCKKDDVEVDADKTSAPIASSIDYFGYFFGDSAEYKGIFGSDGLTGVELNSPNGILDYTIPIEKSGDEMYATYYKSFDTNYYDGKLWMKDVYVNKIVNRSKTTWGEFYLDNRYFYKNENRLDSIVIYDDSLGHVYRILKDFLYENGNLTKFTEMRDQPGVGLVKYFVMYLEYDTVSINPNEVNTSVLNFNALKYRGVYSSPDLVARTLFFSKKIAGIQSSQLLKRMIVENTFIQTEDTVYDFSYEIDSSGRVASMLTKMNGEKDNIITFHY